MGFNSSVVFASGLLVCPGSVTKDLIIFLENSSKEVVKKKVLFLAPEAMSLHDVL